MNRAIMEARKGIDGFRKVHIKRKTGSGNSRVFYVFDNTEFKGYNNKRDSLTGGTVGSSP